MELALSTFPSETETTTRTTRKFFNSFSTKNLCKNQQFFFVGFRIFNARKVTIDKLSSRHLMFLRHPSNYLPQLQSWSIPSRSFSKRWGYLYFQIRRKWKVGENCWATWAHGKGIYFSKNGTYFSKNGNQNLSSQIYNPEKFQGSFKYPPRKLLQLNRGYIFWLKND